MIFLIAWSIGSVVRWRMLFAKLKEATAAMLESAAVMLLLMG